MEASLQELGHRLALSQDYMVEVRLNNNRNTFINVLESSAHLIRVSLHQMFLKAPENVMQAVAKFIRGKIALPLPVRSYIQENLHTLDTTQHLGRIKLETVGRTYDLQKIYREVNAQYFNNTLDLHITWYGDPVKRPRSQMTFGLFDPVLKLIKIHRLLDSETVPNFFIAFVIYHEMLHAIHPPYVDEKNTLRIHNLEFKTQEKCFQQHTEAMTWAQQHRCQFFCNQ
jgi:hypothetical protein